MSGTLKSLLFVFGTLLLSACVSTLKDIDWPEELPDQQVFAQYWQADADNQQQQGQANYLLWVKRFYTGFNLVPGWQEMMSQVSARLADQQWPGVQAKLNDLGRSIGSEWAKTNKYRKIDTRCVAVWRDALLESLAQDDLESYLSRLKSDVAELLSGSISQDDIFFERYYVDEFDF